MWPWEHAALGYLLVSAATHVIWSNPPSDTTALMAVFGSQFPDLVDKPLGWVFEIFPSGVSVAHSVFIAVGFCFLVWTLQVVLDRRKEALAFCLGYLSHIPADVFYPVLSGGEANWSVALWPVMLKNARGETPAMAYVWMLFEDFLRTLGGSGAGISWYLVLEIMLVTGTFVVWFLDGHPGLPPYRKHRTPEM